MTGKLKAAALGLVVIGLGACEDPVGVGVRTGLAGTYEYEAMDSSGNSVVSGTITILINEDSTVTGEWSFTGDRNDIGPQIGSGILSGTILPDGTISIDLNPGSADNNVVLEWNQGDGSIDTGIWTWSTISGPASEGTFRAEFESGAN
jgi:hypothetical protein